MAENLLYPVRLDKPPSLLIDPVAMFGTHPTYGSVPMINCTSLSGKSYVRLISSGPEPYTFRLGILARITKATTNVSGYVPLLMTGDRLEIEEYRGHGWSSDVVSDPVTVPPEETKSYPSMNVPPNMRYQSVAFEDQHHSLFKMEGENLGTGMQFYSERSYSLLIYDLNEDVMHDIIDVKFSDMYFYMSRGTFYLEIVVKITQSPKETNYGFRTGALV